MLPEGAAWSRRAYTARCWPNQSSIAWYASAAASAVVARAGVVEEGVVDAREHPDLVDQTGGFEGAAGGLLRGVDPRVELGVDAEDGGVRRTAEVGVGRCRPVERNGRRQPRFAGGQQLPRHPTAEAEPDRRQLGAGRASFELVEPGPQICDQPFGRGVAERGGRVAL